MPQGGFNIPTAKLNQTTVVTFKLTAVDPVYFISNVESNLLQAEAVIRGWGSGDAKALYDQALKLDFARKGVSIGGLIDPDGVYEFDNSAPFEKKLETIIMAKWAAFAGSQGIEAFFETNRTGYPKVSSEPTWKNDAFNNAYVSGLTYSLEGVTGGKFPKRMIYPQDEVNLNSNFPGQTKLTDKVWWDKKAN
jgi:hypothetical protein